MPKFKIADVPTLLKKTYLRWDADDPWRLSAVVAYYAILSLPGLLIIIVNIVGAIWGEELVQGRVTSEISSAIGPGAGDAVREMVKETSDGNKSLISSILGIIVLIFGATGVFYHIQISFNKIWQVHQDPTKNFWIQLLKDRARSFAFIMVIGFLLLTSFVVTAAISALKDFIKMRFPDIVLYVAYLLDTIISLGTITVLFALMFKFLPDVKVRWKTVWAGAMVTSILFVIGKFLLGIYFGQADPGSTYGAAGSIILILLWVFYSCLIMFFGAAFTKIYSECYEKKKPQTFDL